MVDAVRGVYPRAKQMELGDENVVVSLRNRAYLSPVTKCFPFEGDGDSMFKTAFSLLLRKPWRAPALVGMAWAYRSRTWYKTPPFLPLPPQDYLRWRNDTAYGREDAQPPLDEFDRFVVWSARMRRWMRG